MMNLEDKIIAYLDGTLDERSRAELLHTLSVSPEKRKLLEEHIKLREIISLGHKPASVPLLTERKLADRIPMLMQELPYLAEKSNRIAAPIIGTSTSYFTLLGRQVSSFFTSRLGQAVSLGSLALIGGMSWYMARSNGDEQLSSPKSEIVQSQQGGSTNSTSLDNSHQTSSNEVVNSNGASVTDQARNVNLSSTTSRVSVKHNRVEKATRSSTSSKNEGLTNNTPSASADDLSNSNAPGRDGLANSVTPNEPSTEDDAKSQISDSKNTDSQKPQEVNSVIDPKDLPPLPLPSKDRNVTGRIVLQADYSSSVSVRPNVEQQKYETASGIGFPVFGAGYEFDNHWAIGAEVGKSSLSQQQQTVDKPRGSQGPMNSPISVNERVTYTTGVNDVNAYWTQATLRYTANPNDRLRWEVSVGAGAAFVEGISPMLSAGLATSYDLGEVVALTLGVTGRAAWLSGLNAEDGASSTLSPGQATAVVSHRPLTDDLFSSSIAGRVGIRFRFF
jgi:hypothetical protein